MALISVTIRIGVMTVKVVFYEVNIRVMLVRTGLTSDFIVRAVVTTLTVACCDGLGMMLNIRVKVVGTITVELMLSRVCRVTSRAVL